MLVGAVLVLAGVGCLLGSGGVAALALPHRNTSAPDCAHEPPYPGTYRASLLGNNASYPIVGGVDANGCDSWVYQLAPSFGPDQSFFAGSGFHVGVKAYQYGTQETTELQHEQQLIAVRNPTREWLRVYKGFDVCTKDAVGGTERTTCLAPAVEPRPADNWPFILVGIILVMFLGFIVHALRPAGPVRRRRHFRRVHHGLAGALRWRRRHSSIRSRSASCRSACADWNGRSPRCSPTHNITGSVSSSRPGDTVWRSSHSPGGRRSRTFRSLTTFEKK